MKGLRLYDVAPRLPGELRFLETLTSNMWWCWNEDAKELFRRIDYQLWHETMLNQCLELMLRSRLRHGSREIWLSPFLKGPMSQHFAHIVHPERRALVNELRARGVIRVEERENLYADHPYSVIVIDDGGSPASRRTSAQARSAPTRLILSMGGGARSLTARLRPG